MRILFLNQYFPPDPAPTGILLHELGEYLQSQGHTVEFVASKQSYRGAKKGRRMVRELAALCSIFWRGWKAARADVIFSASSPPCLLVVAAFVAKLHRAKSAHWLMDMYPELAVALGEVKPGLVANFIGKWMGWAYRRTDLVVALDEDMAERLKKYGVNAEIIQPWILQPLLATAPATPVASDPEWTWIYSGNLGRAHEWETLLEVQSLLEKRGLPWRLLFQGGGPSWPLAQARARELNLGRCEWKDYAPEPELQRSLLRARVLVVTQKPETQGLLWPSKLALVSTLPRPILWVGPVDGAIAQQLSKLPCAGIFPPGSAGQIADWLEKIYKEGVQPGRSGVADARQNKNFALLEWSGLLEKL